MYNICVKYARILNKSKYKTMNKQQLKELDDLTQANNHTGARLFIAKSMNLLNETIIFTKLEELHRHLGCMPYDLGQYRERVTDEMLKNIKNKDEEQYNLIYNCL